MIMRNETNIFVPDYLNEQFFCNALEEGFRETSITIHEINFEFGSNPGENYCSSIYRVRITFERSSLPTHEREKVSLIVKTIPVTPETQFLDDAGVFVKELITYYDMIPRLEILVENEQFGAKCFYSQRQPVNTIVFHDLKEEGFAVASRQEGLNWDHANLMLQKLAKFHATSMVIAKKDTAIVKRFLSGMVSPETVFGKGAFAQIFGSSLAQLVEVMADWEGFAQIQQKLKRYVDNFLQITSEIALPKKSDKYTVLNHGDMWTNNFLFAYDNAASPKKPTRAVFVDFQLSFYGSPGCDINFFLNTSVQLDVLQHRRDELIESYYKCFAEALEYLRYEEIPTLADLKSEIRQRELYGLFALYAFLPMVTMSKELSEDNTVEAMVDEEVKHKKFAQVFANEQLQKHLKYSLKRMNELGVLDEF